MTRSVLQKFMRISVIRGFVNHSVRFCGIVIHATSEFRDAWGDVQLGF